MKMEKQIQALALPGLALVGLLSIVASGGGGSDETSTTTPFSATSSGVASKGIIQQGVVTAEELDTNGTPLRSVGTAETDSTGAYSLTIGSDYTGGPLLLTISGKSDGSTTMKCDVAAGCGAGISFGDTMPLDDTFAMTAIVPPVSDGASVSAQITPYTYMAARRALSAGSVDADTVRNAISEVNQMVGVNILEVPPVDITDPTALDSASPEARAYAAFVAGAGELALAGGNLQNGLDGLAQSFDDGVLNDSDPIDPAALLAAVQTEASNAGVDSDPVLGQVLATISAGISGDCNTTGCSYDPQPADSATQTAVEKARDIVAQTRAWGTTLSEMETPLDAFGNNLDVAGNVLDANSRVLGDTLGYVLEAVDAKLTAMSNAGTLDVGTYSADVLDAGATSLGTATITVTDVNGLNIAISTGRLSNGVTVSLGASSNIPASDFFAGNSFSLASADLGLRGSVSNDQATMSLDVMELKATFESPLSVDLAGGTSPQEPVLTSASLTGGLTLQANGATFSGDASITFVPLAGGATSTIDSLALSKLSLKRIALSGDFSDASGNSFSADFALTANNAENFDTLGGMACNGWKYVSESFQGDAMDAAGYVAANSTLPNADLTYASYNYWGDETVFQGIDRTNFFPVYQTIPGDVLGVENSVSSLSSQTDCAAPVVQIGEAFYYYSAIDNLTTINGEVYFGPVETATDFANLTLNLTMDLALTGYPDTTAVITADRTTQKGGELLLTLSHGGQSVTFSASKTDATPGTGTLTVTTPDGAKLEVAVTEGSATGTVKVGGTTVGTLEDAGNGLIMVRYNDGTFETLQ